MTSTAETSTTSAPDMWDRLEDGAYWLPLAPTTVSEYFNGEVDNLFIRRDGASWWLDHTGEAGQSQYASLADAKAAGDGILQKSYDAVDASIIASLGVSTDDWNVVVDNGTIILTSVADSNVEIFGSDGHWSMDGDIVVRTRSLVKALEVANLQVASAPAF